MRRRTVATETLSWTISVRGRHNNYCAVYSDFQTLWNDTITMSWPHDGRRAHNEGGFEEELRVRDNYYNSVGHCIWQWSTCNTSQNSIDGSTYENPRCSRSCICDVRSTLYDCYHHVQRPTDTWEWPSELASTLTQESWRKSPQWFGMRRPHVLDVMNDEHLWPVFQRHCRNHYSYRRCSISHQATDVLSCKCLPVYS